MESRLIHIGLLMADAARRCEGLGRKMHDAAIDLICRTPGIQSIRLSIVDTIADSRAVLDKAGL